MPLHTKLQFAEMCGITKSILAVYVLRKKVILEGEYVDDTVSQNILFLKKFQSRVKKNEAISAKDEVFHAEPKPPKILPPANKDQADANAWDLEQQIKQANLNIKLSQAELFKLQKEKLQGLLIPTPLAQSVTISLSEALKIAFHEGAENLIVILSQKKQLSAPEMADIRRQLVLLINESLDKAIQICKKNIKNIVKEYSEKKG